MVTIRWPGPSWRAIVAAATPRWEVRNSVGWAGGFLVGNGAVFLGKGRGGEGGSDVFDIGALRLELYS